MQAARETGAQRPDARFLPAQRASKMTAVGFEPTQLALVELESTPLDHSGKLSTGDAAISFAVCATRRAHVVRSLR